MLNNVLPSVLNQIEIDEILSTLDPGSGHVDTSHYYSGSIGFYNLEITNRYLDRLENMVKQVVGDNIAFENSYTRIYPRGSHLGFHIDRPGLDVTVSLCLKRDRPWPLFVSHKEIDHEYSEANFTPYKTVATGYDLLPGQAVIAEGRRFPHWRDPLQCEDTESNTYVFYHWRRT